MPVLYRKYRPQKFSELFGQEVIAKSLLTQLESGKISHGYLFSGPRGTGKTSTARIFARAVNCEVYRAKSRGIKSTNQFGEPCNKCDSCLSMLAGSHLDLIEIDAASNRGIDEVRDLREKIKLSPVLGKYKVYIIDEAHMLTTEAFNALLKTLEEPPAHAIFILATTEFSKLPATIVSRLSHFAFSRAKQADIIRVLEKVTKEEKVKVSSETLVQIAKNADGAFRDAVSLLDQYTSGGNIADVGSINSWKRLYEFSELLVGRDLTASVIYVEKLVEDGLDVSQFMLSLVRFLEAILFVQIGAYNVDNFEFDENQMQKINELSVQISFADLQTLMKHLVIAEGEVKNYPLAQIPFVLAICKWMGDRRSDVAISSNIEDGKLISGMDDQQLNRDVDVNDKKIETEDLPQSVGETKPLKAQSKKLKKGAVAISDVLKKWGEFLEKVKPVNAHVVALLRSTRPAVVDGDILTLEVFYKFHKQKLEEMKIIHMLEDVFSQTIGTPVRFKFVLAASRSQPTKAVKASDVIELTDSNLGDLEKIAHEIFSE